MYRIMSEGGDVAIVEAPVFIRKHENGCFVHSERDCAQGVAINGKPYNLLGAAPLEEGLDTVLVIEVNGGEFVFEQRAAIYDLETLAVEREYRDILREYGV